MKTKPYSSPPPPHRSSLIYKLFYGAAIYFFLIEIYYFFFGNRAIDIQMHDTYFVIGLVHIYLPFAILLFIFGKTYEIRGRNFNRILGIFHFLGTAIPLFIAHLFLIDFPSSGDPRRYYTFNVEIPDDPFHSLVLLSSGLIIVFCIAQLIFIINWLKSIFSN